MRISTKTLFETATTQIGTLQSQLSRTQMQLSAQRRLLTAADDPIASARALEVTQSQSMNTQFGTNRQNARASLSLVDQTLMGVVGLIQDVQSLVVDAGNGTYTPTDRAAKATELEGRLTDLLGLANTADGIGGYLFSGYMTTTQPFSQTPTGAQYQGDQGNRSMQVGSARKMGVSENGSAIFEANLTGNGDFQTLAAAANTGSGIISPGAVTDRSKLTGHDYAISFAVTGSPPVTTYDVVDNSATPPSTVVTGAPYQAGASITFDGMSFDIKGDPADGDTFTVQPSQKQSIFETITNLIATLRAPAEGSSGKAALANGLNTASLNLKNSLDNVLTVEASVGARLKELDYLDSSGDDLDIQYTATLGTLQDLDYTKAISLFLQQQMTLQAAQQSFKSVSGLSLFNYLNF
ncbi:flagellar hook-associated protein FlgL [Massilia horti]|uniref:Flagellar hook-associated protein 3 n=1 Tax=Massilia horti TaxID=2562153 RepID=A0A4Y9T381_9BURK|nr:flagellar hook-associated protein FlgL [Massilia horti]TFW32080.1 flagellar hook-associated protein 3 [Massilia horti]